MKRETIVAAFGDVVRPFVGRGSSCRVRCGRIARGAGKPSRFGVGADEGFATVVEPFVQSGGCLADLVFGGVGDLAFDAF